MQTMSETSSSRTMSDREFLIALREEMTYEPQHDPMAEVELEDGRVASPSREEALAQAWAKVWERIGAHLEGE